MIMLPFFRLKDIQYLHCFQISAPQSLYGSRYEGGQKGFGAGKALCRQMDFPLPLFDYFRYKAYRSLERRQ